MISPTVYIYTATFKISLFSRQQHYSFGYLYKVMFLLGDFQFSFFSLLKGEHLQVKLRFQTTLNLEAKLCQDTLAKTLPKAMNIILFKIKI